VSAQAEGLAWGSELGMCRGVRVVPRTSTVRLAVPGGVGVRAGGRWWGVGRVGVSSGGGVGGASGFSPDAGGVGWVGGLFAEQSAPADHARAGRRSSGASIRSEG